MTQSPTVSVVTIFFNAERFLDEAVESVLKQTFESWELLLVDDGSTDGSTKIARTWAERHPEKVHYLHHKGHRNCGMSASRNLGISHARGIYLALLDADDVWLPQKLQEQTTLMEMYPEAAMVYSASQYWFSWTNRDEDRGRDFLQPLGVSSDQIVAPPRLFSLFVRNIIPSPCPSNIMVRTDTARALGGFEEQFRGMYEDQAFFAKVLLNAPAFVAGQLWDRYRKHDESCVATAKKNGAYHRSRYFFLRWIFSYLLRHRHLSPPLLKAVAGEMIRATAPRAYEIAAGIKRVLARLLTKLKAVARRGYHTLARWRHHLKDSRVKRKALGNLQQLKPISTKWGFDRGSPIDRCYIEHFLRSHANYVQGHVLEIGENIYTRKFGGRMVARSDVLHVSEKYPGVTIIADLTSETDIPSNTFDCIICTQTLHLIYDVRSAIRTLYRILRPGGVLLVTVPSITPLCRDDVDKWGDFWRFTRLSARCIFEEVAPPRNVELSVYGNVLSAAAFLYGLSAEELHPRHLEYHDPDYEVIIGIRVTKT